MVGGGKMLQKFLKGKTKGDIVFEVALIVTCIFLFLIIAYPMYFILIASISDSNMVSKGLVTLFPRNISFYGFEKILQDARIWTGYRNTLIYTIGGTIINLLFTLPAAYALSRQDFKPRRILMFIFTFTILFIKVQD
jgi:putative aldouronate transport system permease protein